jgi:hypothetical protein
VFQGIGIDSHMAYITVNRRRKAMSKRDREGVEQGRTQNIDVAREEEEVLQERCKLRTSQCQPSNQQVDYAHHMPWLEVHNRTNEVKTVCSGERDGNIAERLVVEKSEINGNDK